MSIDPRATRRADDPPPPPPPISPATALDLFVNSGIGAEGVPSTATSELMLRTVTKALGAAATLVDSPAVGIAGAKPITKTIRGAGVGVYLLSETLGGKGIKRGLGLFVLAIGGALVAISLITGSAPAWMATLGFGLLLGGLAYAALATGSLALALVLATPVVPLLVWTATSSAGATDGSGGTNAVQIVLVALLVGTLLIIGTVRDPQRRPASWLSLRPFVYVVMTVLALVTIGVVVHAVVVEFPALFASVLPWIAGVGLIVLTVAALLHAQRIARAAALTHGAASGTAIAAGWAWVFGTAYVLLALVTLLALRRYPHAATDVETLLMSLLATFAVLATVCFALCLRIRVPVGRRQEHSNS